MSSFNYHYLEEPVNGGAGIVLALIMSVKQRVPDVSMRERESCMYVCVLRVLYVCVCVRERVSCMYVCVRERESLLYVCMCVCVCV
jgi:hypothetical protein